MKKNILICLIPIATMALISCTGRSTITSDTSSSEQTTSSSSGVDPELPGCIRQEVSMVSSDFRSTYAPALGDAKLLVIPISFDGGTASGYTSQVTPWTETSLNKVNKLYFSELDPLSLKSYYNTASMGQMHMGGMVSDLYSNTTRTISSILNASSMDVLWDMMDEASDWVLQHHSDVDWSEYDLNRDGCFDNIHFIVNYTSNQWANNMWPHMFYTERFGTLENPRANVYSLSGIGFFNDAITAIHEQGHIFGLEDYYDYTTGGGGVNYIGGLDMQSHNCLDWNSFSKLSTGWIEPLVITGSKQSTTVTMSAASVNGDCLLIPADYTTWNGSAFDEYILLELFSPFGNNAKFQDTWNAYIGANKAGVRLYHVDARVYGSNLKHPTNQSCLIVANPEEQQIKCKEDISEYLYNVKGANNSENWLDYEGGIVQLKNHPLLTLIQKGNNFTFANSSGRTILNSSDLFYAGDKFTFDKYSHFFNKSDEAQELTDKKEVFPYEISIDSISEDLKSVTITVTIIK